MINLETIQSGLDNDEFFLEFLPTIRLKDNKCVGAETLVRWKKEEQLIPPLEFIPVIENTKLSGAMTYWIIEEIGRVLGGWLHQNEDVHIGINIPPELIGRGGIKKAAERAGLLDVAEKLILEITERGIPDEIAIDAVESAKGLHVAVDDFGTGDLNLLDLSRMNINVIKIDKAFVDQISEADSSPKMIRGLIAMAREFEAIVIAEGVENDLQVRKLKELGVDMAQGWYYSKSLSWDSFLAYFNANQS